MSQNKDLIDSIRPKAGENVLFGSWFSHEITLS